MPLNEEEQRILDEIESHFYEEEEVAQSDDRSRLYASKAGLVVPVGFLAAGMLVVLVFFTSRLLVALGGFVVMVAAATFLVQGLRARSRFLGDGVGGGNGAKAGRFGSWPR